MRMRRRRGRGGRALASNNDFIIEAIGLRYYLVTD